MLGALIVVGGISIFTARSILQSRQQAAQEAALPPPEQVKVAALGRLEPDGRVVEVAASENGRVTQILVKEGDTVKTGQILAYLDNYDVRLAERDYAASQLAEAQEQYTAQTSLGQAQVEEASSRIAQIDQPQAQAIQAQDARIKSIEADLKLAQSDLDRFQDLFRNGAISAQELDQKRATVNRLAEDIRGAIATKSQLEKARTTDMQTARTQVASAEATLRSSQAQIQLESAARNLELAEARLALTIVRAPRDGQILKINAEPGEAVTTANPLMSMGNTKQMYVVAEVYETDIGLVKPGQKVTVASRNGAFDKTLTGKVEQVGLQIFKNNVLDDDPAANADARVVEVRIRVDQSAVVAGLTNLQVDVLIDIES